MKKLLTLTLAAAMTISLASCQAIPVTKIEQPQTTIIEEEQAPQELPAVEQQPQSEFVQLVDAPPLPLAQYRADQRWTDELTNKDGDLTIKIDTDILTPDTDAYPVYTTRWEPLSPEKVKQVSDVLFKGKTIYNDNRYIRIKSDILEDINKLEEEKEFFDGWMEELKYIIENEEPRFAKGSEEYENWEYKNEYEKHGEQFSFDASGFQSEYDWNMREGFWGVDQMELLKDDLENAPEKRPEMTETNFEYLEDHNTFYMNLTDNDKLSLYAGSSDDYMPDAMILLFNENEYATSFSTLKEDEQLPIDTTKEEAANLASATLKAMGIEDFVLSGVTKQAALMDEQQQEAYYKEMEEAFSNGDYTPDVSPEADDYAYVFTFTPMLGDIPSEYVPNSLSTTAIAIDGAPHLMFWEAETIEVTVGDDGVIGFEWKNIGQTPEVKNENVEIMSFNDIKDVATQMLPIKMSDHPGYIIDEKASTAIIDKITLSMMRVVDDSELKETPHGNEANGWESTFLNGADYEQMYIPVWDFYGHYENDTTQTSFLTLNAIDGTSIDRAIGF